MNGILIIDKEAGYTSRDVVNLVSKYLGTKKIGHTGTLDPIATGVLVLCVGKGLKCVEMLMDHDKEYIAKVRLGVLTDTLDITGVVVDQKEVPCIENTELEQVLNCFLGKGIQIVPKYSAIKVNGKKLYEYARNGEEVLLPKKEIEIFDMELIRGIENQEFVFRCCVSKGTYIRSLIRDIGEKLGTCATMVELRRVRVGDFCVDHAVSLEEIRRGCYQMIPIQDVLKIPQVVVDENLEQKIRNGCVLPKFFDDERVMVLNQNGDLLAIYEKKDSRLVRPYRMFL